MTPSGIEPATFRLNQLRHRVPLTLIALLSKTSTLALRPTHHPVQWMPGFFPGVEWPGREFDHATPSSAEDKNEWMYASTPPVRLHSIDPDKFMYTYYQTQMYEQ